MSVIRRIRGLQVLHGRDPGTVEAPAPGRQGSSAVRRRRGATRRGGLLGELALAVPPTLTVLAALILVERLTHQRILFASLASSAFLIYRDPLHHMNGARVMVTAHLTGAALGVGAALLLGPGYPAGAVAMTLTIVALILLDAVHPPAISTALGFAVLPKEHDVVGVFLLALGLVTALVLLQRIALAILDFVNRSTPTQQAHRLQARAARAQDGGDGRQ